MNLLRTKFIGYTVDYLYEESGEMFIDFLEELWYQVNIVDKHNIDRIIKELKTKINKHMKFDRSKEFTKDNDWGTWGEGIMINFIQEHFKRDDKFVSYWYNSSDLTNKKSQMKKWDLRFGCYKTNDRINYYDKFEVEVKTDGYSINTGNLVFEESCGGKKSGVFGAGS